LSNKGGQFSLRYPCDWGSLNCDPQVASNAQGFSPNAAFGPDFKGAKDTCFYGEGPPTSWVVEFPSDTPQGSRPGQYVGELTSSTPITVDGVQGTRQTATVSADNTIPPVKGATEVVYTFTVASRTYIVYYTREPGEPDLAATVDLLVERTLKFTA